MYRLANITLPNPTFSGIRFFRSARYQTMPGGVTGNLRLRDSELPESKNFQGENEDSILLAEVNKAIGESRRFINEARKKIQRDLTGPDAFSWHRTFNRSLGSQDKT